jgi:hypothetical protein
LTDSGTKFPLTISGISSDQQFRGHIGSPSLISPDMSIIFQKKGEYSIRENFWSSVFASRYSMFSDHILYIIDKLQTNFGDLNDAEHHLSYALYVVSPEYFAGEIKIANHFTTLRVPSWDQEIVDLSYSIVQSTLSFSQYTGHTRGSRDEMVLQSYLLHQLHPPFVKISIGNTRPDMVLKGEAFFKLYIMYNSIKKRIAQNFFRQRSHIPLEDWDNWLNRAHKEFVNYLIFSEDSKIRKYISNEYLEKLKVDRNIYYIGKLMTAEIILRLIDNNWKRFW